MADENPENLPLRIDILVGASFYWDFMTGEIIRGQSGPVALSSKLGYILSGSVGQVNNSSSTFACVSHVLKVEFTGLNPKEINKSNLLNLYGNEELVSYCQEDVEMLSKFEESTVFKVGRFEVRLPFKMDPALIGDNYRNAVNRLGSLLKQLEKN